MTTPKNSPFISLKVVLDAEQLKKDQGALDALNARFQTLNKTTTELVGSANTAGIKISDAMKAASVVVDQQLTAAFDKAVQSASKTSSAFSKIGDVLSRARSDVAIAGVEAKAKSLDGTLDRVVNNARKGFESLIPGAIRATDTALDFTETKFKQVFKSVSSLDVATRADLLPKISAGVTPTEEGKPETTAAKALRAGAQFTSQLAFGTSGDISNILQASSYVLRFSHTTLELGKNVGPLAKRFTDLASEAVKADGGLLGMASSVTKVGLAGIAATAVLVAAALAMNSVSKASADLVGVLGAQEKIYGTLKTSTTKQAQESIVSLVSDNEIANAVKKQAEKVINALGGIDATKRLSYVPGAIGDPARKALEVYDAQAARITENNTILEALNRATADGTLAENDLLAARNKEIQAISDSIQKHLDLARIVEASSSAELKIRIKQDQDEYNLRQQAISDIIAKNKLVLSGSAPADVQNAYDQQVKANQDLLDEINKLNGGLIDQKEKTEGVVKANQDLVDGLKKRSAAEAEYLQLVRDGNAQAIRDQIKAEKELQDSRKAEADDLLSAVAKATGYNQKKFEDALAGKGDKALQPLVDRIKELMTESDDGAKHLANLNKALAEVSAIDFSNFLKDPLGGLKKAFTEATGISIDDVIAKVKERVDQRNQNILDIYTKYEDDVKNIEEQSTEERANIQKRYNDSLVSAAKQAADAAANALENLVESRADAAKQFNKGEKDAVKQIQKQEQQDQIVAQRQERDQLVQHFRDLENIRRQAAQRERDLIQNRDFAGLFNLREDTTNQLADAQRTFIQSQEDQTRARRDQADDQVRQLADERQARLDAYRDQLQDLQDNYTKQLAEAKRQETIARIQAGVDRDAALNDEAASYKKQRDLRKASLDNELLLVADYGVKAGKIAADKLKEALNYLESIQSRPTSPATQSFSTRKSIATRPFGGGLSPFDLSKVNDLFPGQRESYNDVPFPPGLGLFMPFQSGYVNPGKGGNLPPISMNFNITESNNAQMTAVAVRTEVKQVLVEILKPGAG